MGWLRRRCSESRGPARPSRWPIVIQHCSANLILAHNKTLAAQLYGEMREFFPNNAVEYFVSYYDYYQPEAYVPSTDTYIEKDASSTSTSSRCGCRPRRPCSSGADAIIVATVSAIYGLGDPAALSRHGDASGRVASDQPARYAAAAGRASVHAQSRLNSARGTFRVRGDVIDVFPAESGARGDSHRAVR